MSELASHQKTLIDVDTSNPMGSNSDNFDDFSNSKEISVLFFKVLVYQNSDLCQMNAQRSQYLGYTI